MIYPKPYRARSTIRLHARLGSYFTAVCPGQPQRRPGGRYWTIRTRAGPGHRTTTREVRTLRNLGGVPAGNIANRAYICSSRTQLRNLVNGSTIASVYAGLRRSKCRLGFDMHKTVQRPTPSQIPGRQPRANLFPRLQVKQRSALICRPSRSACMSDEGRKERPGRHSVKRKDHLAGSGQTVPPCHPTGAPQHTVSNGALYSVTGLAPGLRHPLCSLLNSETELVK